MYNINYSIIQAGFACIFFITAFIFYLECDGFVAGQLHGDQILAIFSLKSGHSSLILTGMINSFYKSLLYFFLSSTLKWTVAK
jgi:hypothetical protein